MTFAARWGIAVATASAALLTACSGGEDPAAGGPATAVPPASSGPASPATPPPSGGTPDLGEPETVATGIETPWGLAFLPDGSALVAERDSARVLRVTAGGGPPREVYRVPGVSASGEGGLLGLAVAKDHARTRFVYAYHTAADDNRIVRFKLGSDAAPEVIFDGIDKAGIHNGGRIAFGPDGMLYAGTGDAGDGSASQDPDDTNGKILRLTPEGRPAPGNPTAGSPVWSLGHRNVQGLAWSADRTMYAVEFGQNRFDEVNKIEAGRNYGWPEVEGKAGDDRYADPLITWPTDQASPSGAAIAGSTLYAAALRGERLWTVPLGGGKPKAELSGRYGRLRTVAVAPDGALWLTTSNTDGRGDVRDGDDRILRFPAR
ncbi:PQQ-dependent sugar dehydrogenase [Pseudosporangium ferrugineum]|uniref:Glucose/arabinose dehydrogenase n=1 Tax=Pseudosporangium ferrugineum TaxID=439699 RepID=A0A2T0S2P7_9ACTN|nr:PQQ-dependent sugar dehydrogenase [Pseudosporangium ferrugineum]PRY27689.1 glucose/arabinose dehydrogenase [Pseudosporangium ferrugineum]